MNREELLFEIEADSYYMMVWNYEQGNTEECNRFLKRWDRAHRARWKMKKGGQKE